MPCCSSCGDKMAMGIKNLDKKRVAVFILMALVVILFCTTFVTTFTTIYFAVKSKTLGERIEEQGANSSSCEINGQDTCQCQKCELNDSYINGPQYEYSFPCGVNSIRNFCFCGK